MQELASLTTHKHTYTTTTGTSRKITFPATIWRSLGYIKMTHKNNPGIPRNVWEAKSKARLDLLYM